MPKLNTFSSVATSTSLEPPYSSFPTSLSSMVPVTDIIISTVQPFQTPPKPPLLGLTSPSDLVSPSASFSDFASSSSSQSPSSSPFIRKLTLQSKIFPLIHNL